MSGSPLIHIGFYRTASSWLQKHNFQPASGYQQLLDPFGTQLLLIDPSPFSYSPQNTLQTVEQQVPANLLENKQAVVTAETLSGDIMCGGYDAKQNADRLKSTWPQAKVLLVTREQKQLIRSMYKTMVVWGLPHGIKHLLSPPDPRTAPQFNLDFVRFGRLAEYHASLYGAENLLVLPYELFQDKPRDFLNRVHRFGLGRDLSDKEFNRLPVGSYVNRNHSLFYLMVQRWLNRLFLANAFNAAGLINASEDRTWARIRRHKKLPKHTIFDNYLERRFSRLVAQQTKEKFLPATTAYNNTVISILPNMVTRFKLNDNSGSRYSRVSKLLIYSGRFAIGTAHFRSIRFRKWLYTSRLQPLT